MIYLPLECTHSVGWGHVSDRSRAGGCNGHLVKPVTLADIERLLGAVSFRS